jgi:CHAT domain-containing protein/Flp pilus assembly protein TadD
MGGLELSQAEEYLNSGQQNLDTGNYLIAKFCFEKAIALNPELAEAWEGKAATLRKLGRHEEAIAASEKAITLRVSIAQQAASFWYTQGWLQLNVEDFEAALKSFDQALELNPKYTDALTGKGVSLNNLKCYSEALKPSVHAINLDPKHAHAWYVKGYAEAYLGLYKNAIESFDQAIGLNLDFYDSWHRRGLALAALKCHEDASVCFDRAIKLKPDFLEAWNSYGATMFNLERYETALTSFDHVLKLKPDFYDAYFNRGFALYRLNRYEDAIRNYDQGLIHVLKDIQPEGWGVLYHGQGDIYRFHSQRTQNIQVAKLQYLFKALKCYQNALQTLKDFPENYLDLILSLIKTYLGLANSEAANRWRIEGLEVFRQLLNTQSTPQLKREIETQFSGFSQVAIDAMVSTGNLTVALEAAERYKNRCLNWILDEWQEQVFSPSYAEMQELLDSNHEIIYWHLSEETLTTFILKSHKEAPTVLIQQSAHFETLRKDWDKRYGDYRSKGKDQAQHQAHHPWRDTLKTELDGLKAILDIEKIEAHLSPHTHLILIPHRDLHRFPIHALFGDDRITTYLPSIKVGLAQKPPSTPPTRFLLNVEDPTRSDQPPLQFARLESAIIQAMFAPNVKAIDSDNGDRATVETALQEHYGIFHFTGHGDYDGRQPEHSAIGLIGTDRLTAKEINALNLQQYELVCLSACETALTGRQTINTEYVGLTSAFLQAGVSQVLSTLWTVQEVSNAYLMIRFYQFLQNGMTAAVALKRSQSWLSTVTSLELADWLIKTSSLKSLDPLIKQELEQQAFNLREEANASTIDLHHPPYADPYHWAAFTLTGRGFL